MLPLVMWDDAVTNLDNRFDRQWADDNLGAYLNKTTGFDHAFVIDRHNKPIFASVEGADAPLSNYAEFIRPASALVAESERKRGPLLAVRQANGVLAPPVQASTVVAIGDDIYIVIATLVAPDFGRARPRGPMAPIVFTAMTSTSN